MNQWKKTIDFNMKKKAKIIMKKKGLVILTVLLIGCSNEKQNPVKEECNPEVIYEYSNYKGLLINGIDRSHISEKGEVKEGIDPSIVGTWECYEDDTRYDIVVLFSDGSYLIIVKGDISNFIILTGEYSTKEYNLVIGTYIEGKYELSDFGEELIIYYNENERAIYKHVK